MKRLRENRLACGGKRPKAFLGAIIGAVGGLASATIGAISARKQRKQQEAIQEQQRRLQENASMTQAYSNSAELQNDFERQRRMEYKNGGKRNNGISPVIAKGGVAIPISSNVSLLRGRSHKTGGIIIGRGKNSIEAENNEVVQNTGDELRIFSAQPILNGDSPAELVLEGYNPNKVFNAQERYKDINKLNDDGTKKAKYGKEEEIKQDNTYVSKPIIPQTIERIVRGKKWSELDPKQRFLINKTGNEYGLPSEKGLEIVSPEFDILSGVKLIGKTAANIGRNIGETLVSYASPEVGTVLSFIPGGTSIKTTNIKTPTINSKTINRNNRSLRLLKGNIETPRLSLTGRTIDDFKEPIALLESPEVMTRNELKKVNAWAKLWGYDPIPLSKAKYRPNADRAVQDLINQHNTFIRGVRQPNEKQRKKIIEGLKKEGKEINDYNILEYAATHTAGYTGAGRANLHGYINNDIGTIYTSNIGRAAAGYSDLGVSGFGEIPGMPFIVKRPTNFKGSRYSDWIIDNDFNLNNQNSYYHRKVVSDEIARTGKTPKEIRLTNKEKSDIKSKIYNQYYGEDNINNKILNEIQQLKNQGVSPSYQISEEALRYMNKEDKTTYLNYLRQLNYPFVPENNYTKFAKNHRKYIKKVINKKIKKDISKAQKQKIDKYAYEKGYRYDRNDFNNIDSERSSYSTRNTGNAGQHFIFRGPVGEKILESLGPYIPTNEDFIRSTRNHEFYYTPGFSRRSRKLGGTNKIDNMKKFACGGKRRLANGGRQSLNTSLGRKQFEQFKTGMRQATVNNKEWLNDNITSGITPYEVNLRTIEDNLPLDGGRGLIALRRVSEPIVTKSTSKQLSTASQKPAIKKKSLNNTIVQKSNKTQNSQSKNKITQTDLLEILITPANNKRNNKSNNYLTVTDNFSELPNGGIAATIGGKNYYFPTEEARTNFLNKVYSVISKRNSNRKSFSVADYFRNDRSIFNRQNESLERLREQKERRRLYKCGGKTKKAALGMSITGGDILGAGIGALGSIGSGIIGLVGANKMKAPEAPTLYQSAKLKTNYNISPQLAEIERTRQRSLDDINSNTASSVVRLARRTGINLRSADAINNLYGEKENIETQLINQDRLNAQNVRNQNTQAYNQYLNQLNEFQNAKTAARFNAIGNMVEGVIGAAGDVITQGQQRYEDNQKISAIIGSSERNNLSYLIEAGYQPTIEQLDAAISSAKTQEEIDYYTKIKNRMSKSLFR